MSRELDALVAEKVMGLTLVPDKAFAKAKVGMRYVSCTGNPFTLRDGRTVPMPEGNTLPDVPGGQWNDRYGVVVADFLGDEVAGEVAAFLLTPKPFSTDIAAAWELVEKLKEMPMVDVMVWWNCGILAAYGESGWECEVGTFDGDNKQETLALSGLCKTAPEAICRAALKVVK